MKRKIAAFLIFFAFLLSVLCIGIGAEESVYAENIKAINEGVYALSGVMDAYAEADTTEDKGVAIRTNAVVVRYVNMINDLRADGRVSTEVISDEVELLALKGKICGECTWIFESHAAELSKEARERTRVIYEKTIEAVDLSDGYDSLRNAETAHISNLMLSIYEEKVMGLYTPEDSAAVVGIAEAAIKEMRNLSSTDSGEYERILGRCTGEIVIQRRRERAIEQFALSYDKIYGVGSFERNRESDENATYFLYLASESDTAESFNLALESSLLSVLRGCIGDCEGEYTKALLDDITYGLSRLRTEANGTGEIFDAGELLDGILDRFLVAEKKDSLVSYLLECLGEVYSNHGTELLLEYNREGGIFDSCADGRVAEFFLKQAMLRVDWICECERYTEISREGCGEYADDEIIAEFAELYFIIDLEMASAQTLESTRDALRRGRALAEEMSIQFEAKAYISEFSDMIDKPHSSITRIDAPSLRKAILEYDALSAYAKTMVAEEISTLCKGYRAALADHLYYVAAGGGDMRIALEYSEMLEDTLFEEKAERFVDFCEVLVKKAEREMRICGIFKEITLKDEYLSFGDTYKNALRECRDVYLERVRNMPLDRTAPDTELSIIEKSAELEMLRVYSEAVIVSFATDEDSDAVKSIITSAIADLRFADSAEELDAAVVRAELDAYRQRGGERLSAVKVRTEGAIRSFAYLSAEKKGEYSEGLAELLERGISALWESGDMSAAVVVLESCESQMLALHECARLEDLSAARVWISAKINEGGGAALSEIEGMRYIDTTEKEQLAVEARESTVFALQSIEVCASARDAEAILAEYLERLASLSKEAQRRELECAKQFSLSVASARYAETIGVLDGLSYLSSSKIDGVKSMIADKIRTLEDAFEYAESVVTVEACLDSFISALAEAERAAIAEDLGCAITELCESLEKIRAASAARMGEMRYLSASTLAEYRLRADAIAEDAATLLNAATSVLEAERAWQSAKDLYSELTASLERDELACARGQALADFGDSIEASKGRVNALEYLSAAAKEEIFLALDGVLSELSALLKESSTSAEVESRLAEFREKTKALCASAYQKNTAEARAYYTAALDTAFSAYKSADYTAERYALIKEAYDTSRAAISTASDAGEIAELFSAAERSMASVVSIFEDRQAELALSITAEYEALLKQSAQYSREGLAALAEIKSRALDALAEAESAMGLAALSGIADGAISEMRAVGLEWISAGKLGAQSSGFAEYPAGYDYSVGGIWGVVESPSGLPSDLRLSILLSEGNKGYKRLLRAALAESRVSYVGDTPMSDAEIYERLDGLEIKGVFSVKLIRDSVLYNEFSGEYTVRILLPAGMRSEQALRVVYISPDGDAEYYDAVCEDGMLVFKTTHFSDFLVLGERRVNLLPLIAIFAALGVLEGLALIAARTWLGRDEARLCAISPAPFGALSVIAPRGGIAMLITLLAIDATLGVLIFLSIRELRRRRYETRAARIYALPTDFEGEAGEDVPTIASAAGEGVASLPAYLDRVSAEDADSLISDSRASALIIRSERAPRVCRGCKKTFINVDTLSENFARGEAVSLKTLREKGLIPMSACYIKVLARGVIDKPLTVRAQSFSANAVKMIALTGGSAILEGSDLESEVLKKRK